MSPEARIDGTKPWAPPENVSFPELDLQTIRLEDFVSAGRLTPSLGDEERLLLELWRMSFKDRPAHTGESPRILEVDFNGVRSASTSTIQDVLVYSLALFKGQPYSAYAYLDNLTGDAAREIPGMLSESRKPTLVVAGYTGKDTFDLIGSDRRRIKFNIIWQSLHAEMDWVNGTKFSHEVLPHERPNFSLNQMAELGLVIKASRSNIPYFRTVV